MIISIVCRDTSDTPNIRKLISEDVRNLCHYTDQIIKAQVVLSRESCQRVSPKQVKCHLHLHMPGNHIDINTQRENWYVAFSQAIEKATLKLNKVRDIHIHHSRKLYNRSAV